MKVFFDLIPRGEGYAVHLRDLFLDFGKDPIDVVGAEVQESLSTGFIRKLLECPVAFVAETTTVGVVFGAHRKNDDSCFQSSSKGFITIEAACIVIAVA